MGRTLTIRPIDYSLPIGYLNRIGEMTAEAFDGVLDDLAIYSTGQMIINSPVDARITLTELARLFPDSHEYPVGIVASDLIEDDQPLGWVFEAAFNRSRGVVISTYRLDPANYRQVYGDADLVLRRVSVEAIHGLGHNFGLPHHSLRETQKGYLCPMSKTDTSNWREYLFSVIDKRDLMFCDPCYRFLLYSASRN